MYNALYAATLPGILVPHLLALGSDSSFATLPFWARLCWLASALVAATTAYLDLRRSNRLPRLVGRMLDSMGL
jgi:hypothetical protein